jgi:hypothetical protein
MKCGVKDSNLKGAETRFATMRMKFKDDQKGI